MHFKGEFAALRPLEVTDAELTLGWRQAWRARFLQRGAQTIAEQEQWIAAHQQKDELNFIIEYQSRAIGMIALLAINMLHRTAELGRLLVGVPELTHGAPVAFEAELLLCDYAFDELRLHKLYGDIMEDNAAMIRMRRYLGYKVDGVLREHYIYDGVFKSTVAVSLLENEYRGTCRPKLAQLTRLFGRTVHKPSSS